MSKIFFNYNGKTIEGEVKVSLNKEPNYYWCYLTDSDLIDELGKNCILFINAKGVFKTPHYYPMKYRALIYSVENSIKQHLEISNKTEGNA